MKTNAMVRMILYTLAIVLLVFILCVGLGLRGRTLSFGHSGGTTVDGEVSIDFSKIKNIEIDWAAGSVSIRTADTDHITISEVLPENSKYKMSYKISGDTLELAYSNVAIIGFGNWSMPEKDLIITVPMDWVCEELEIDGAALSIEIENLIVEEFDLDGAACSVDFNGSVDRVDIDGASADIYLNCANRVSSINIDGASCDLEVILPKDCGFLVEMDGLSCSFYSDLDYGSGNGSYSYGDRQCNVNVDGISCDVTIQENPVWPITG